MGAISHDLWKNFPRKPSEWGSWLEFDSENDRDNCVITAVAAGTAVLLTDGTRDGGWLRISCVDDTADSGANVQYDHDPIDLKVNKTYRFITVVEMSQDADALAGNGVALESEWLCGICDIDTSLMAGLTDGIYFRKPEDSAALHIVSERDSTETDETTTTTLVVDTEYTLSFKIKMDPTVALTGTITFYVNGVEVGTIHTTTIPSDAAGLCLSFAFQASDAATDGLKWIDVDCMGFLGQR